MELSIKSQPPPPYAWMECFPKKYHFWYGVWLKKAKEETSVDIIEYMVKIIFLEKASKLNKFCVLY